MAGIILDVKIPNIETIRKQLKGMDGKAEVAMYRAINRTIQYMGSYIVDEVVSKRYKVKKGSVQKCIKKTLAKKTKLSGEIGLHAKETVKLKGFTVTPAKQQRSPVTYKSKVLSENALKSLTGNSERSKAFIAKMPNGHIGIYQRYLGKRTSDPRTNSSGQKIHHRNPGTVTKYDEKIKELNGPSIPSMAKSDASSFMVRDKGHEFLLQRINHEIKYLLGGVK